MSSCPSVAELETFLRSDPAGGSDLLRQHVEACETCAAQVEEISRNLSIERELEGLRSGEPSLLESPGLPERVGPYRVLRELGRGGVGVVFLGEQDQPHREVAIKVLHPFSLTARTRARFQVEIEALGRLEHPSIASIFEAGEAETQGGRIPYFAMEFVRGATLDVALAGQGLSLDSRLRLFLQIADAVRHAHRNGLLHRDLKPKNVIVDDTTTRAKVIDFGLARRMDPDATAQTETGQVMGTLAFMSPEQATGKRDSDTRTDVYGLGGVLHFILCGRAPLDLSGISFPEALGRIQNRDPRLPSTIDPELPRDLDWIVQRALEKDPEARYPSVDALIADVEAFQQDRPLQAAPRSLAYRGRLFWRQHRVMVTATALVLLALTAGLIGTWTGLSREAQAKDRALLEADTEGEVRAFLVDLFKKADPRNEEGTITDVRELVQWGGEEALVRLPNRPDVRASILEDLSDIHRHIGETEGAMRLVEAALELRGEHSGDSTLEYFLAEERRGVTLIELGRAGDAIPALQRALSGQRSILGNDHPELIEPISHLATALVGNARLDEAQPLIDEVIAYLDRGTQEVWVEGWDRFLAGTLTQSGEVHRAAAILTKGIRVRESFGGFHHDLARMRVDLGFNLIRIGDHDGARKQLLAGEAGLLEVYGPDHPWTLTARTYLGRLHFELEENELAAEKYREVIADAVDSNGEPTFQGWQARAELGEVLRESGKVDESRTLLDDCLAAFAKLDPMGPALGSARLSRARIHYAEGEFTESEQLMRLALDQWADSPDATTPSRPIFAHHLAISIVDPRRVSEQRDILATYLEESDLLGDITPQSAFEYRLAYGVALQRTGDPEGCVDALSGALPWIDEEEVDPVRALALRHTLAWGLDRTDRVEESIPHLRAVVQGRSKLLGPNEPTTLQALNGLARALGLTGSADEAERMFQELFARAKGSLAPDSDDLGWFRFRYAEFLASQGKEKEALAFADMAFESLASTAPTRGDLDRLRKELRQ